MPTLTAANFILENALNYDYTKCALDEGFDKTLDHLKTFARR
jgi:hypothetical protein